jgi:hypothetical protein
MPDASMPSRRLGAPESGGFKRSVVQSAINHHDPGPVATELLD